MRTEKEIRERIKLIEDIENFLDIEINTTFVKSLWEVRHILEWVLENKED